MPITDKGNFLASLPELERRWQQYLDRDSRARHLPKVVFDALREAFDEGFISGAEHGLALGEAAAQRAVREVLAG